MRNPIYEQALNNSGVQWRYEEEVKLEDINKDKGVRNQARLLMPVDDELAQQYANAMTNGDQFPPLVLYRTSPRSLYVPIDGNNRLAAFSKVPRKKAHDAYIIETSDPKVIDFLTWTFNNSVNGKRLTPEEDIQHAISLVQVHGYSVADVAKACGVKKGALEWRLRVGKTKEVLEAHGVKKYAELDNHKLDSVHSVMKCGEDVAVEVAKAIGGTAATVEESRDLARKVNEAKTHERRLEVIKEYVGSEESVAMRAATRNGDIKRPRPTPRDLLEKHIREIFHLVSNNQDEALHPIGRVQFNQVQVVANEVVLRLKKLFKLDS